MTIAAILGDKGENVISVEGGQRMQDVAALLARKRIGAVPVIESDRVIGIFSERDVIYSLERDGAAALDKPVRELMTAPAITVERGERVDDALSLMTRRRIRHLPVVEDGRCIGFVSIGDLVKYRVGKIEQEADAMRDYIRLA